MWHWTQLLTRAVQPCRLAQASTWRGYITHRHPPRASRLCRRFFFFAFSPFPCKHRIYMVQPRFVWGTTYGKVWKFSYFEVCLYTCLLFVYMTAHLKFHLQVFVWPFDMQCWGKCTELGYEVLLWGYFGAGGRAKTIVQVSSTGTTVTYVARGVALCLLSTHLQYLRVSLVAVVTPRWLRLNTGRYQFFRFWKMHYENITDLHTEGCTCVWKFLIRTRVVDLNLLSWVQYWTSIESSWLRLEIYSLEVWQFCWIEFDHLREAHIASFFGNCTCDFVQFGSTSAHSLSWLDSSVVETDNVRNDTPLKKLRATRW